MEARRTRWAFFFQWGRRLFQHISGDIDSGVDAGADCGGSLYCHYECSWASSASHAKRRENAQSGSIYANVGGFSHINGPAHDYANAVSYTYTNSHADDHAHANSHADPDGPAEAFAHRHVKLALVDVTAIVAWFSI